MKNTQETKPQSSIENTDKQQKPWLFKPGQSGNPAGRPKGAIGFRTKWLQFIEKVAEENKVTPDEVERKLFAVAYKQMTEGNVKYWKDIQDRVYGMATQKIEHTGELTISNVLDQLENGSEIEGQTVETEPLIQDPQQIGEADSIQAESSAGGLPSEEVVSEPDSKE